jgi:hypothetical protein
MDDIVSGIGTTAATACGVMFEFFGAHGRLILRTTVTARLMSGPCVRHFARHSIVKGCNWWRTDEKETQAGETLFG